MESPTVQCHRTQNYYHVGEAQLLSVTMLEHTMGYIHDVAHLMNFVFIFHYYSQTNLPKLCYNCSTLLYRELTILDFIFICSENL